MGDEERIGSSGDRGPDGGDIEEGGFGADEPDIAKTPKEGTDCLPSTSGGAMTFDCRYCLLPDDPKNLVCPCGCDGTLRYCHYDCLKTWVMEKRALSCEICNQEWKDDFQTKLAQSVADAEKNDQERRNATTTSQLGGVAAVSDTPVVRQQTSRGRMCMDRVKVLLLVFVTIGLLYVVLFLSSETKFDFWAVIILRVLSFVLAFYLIGKGIMGLQRYTDTIHPQARSAFVES